MKGKSALNIIGPWSQGFGRFKNNHMTPFLKLFNLYVKMIGEQLIILKNGECTHMQIR